MPSPSTSSSQPGFDPLHHDAPQVAIARRRLAPVLGHATVLVVVDRPPAQMHESFVSIGVLGSSMNSTVPSFVVMVP